MIDIVAFRTEGLGDSTYLLKAEGVAVLVDPQRDVSRFLAALDGVELRWVLETHLHNDYVSGGLDAARQSGAELVLPAAAAPAFRHTPAFHGEEMGVGALTIRPLHTPGHTPEHTSYLVLFDGRELAVFSGGSLLVGSSGRSDLLGPERADTLSRLQYRSVMRLAALPDATALYPTHGAGSFCTVSATDGNTSTVGEERRRLSMDEDSFVAAHLSDLQPYPTYYARMGPLNLAGPAPMPAMEPEKVDAADVDPTATIVDLRPAERFAAGHLPGSINIPLSDQFGVWFGWLIPYPSSPYLVVDAAADLDEALVQLARIGVDAIGGAVINPDVGATSATARLADIPPGAQILDVRSPGEREEFAPPGTFHRYVPDLIEGPPPELDPTRPVWVVCVGGYRSAIAASILRRQGFDALPVTDGGIEAL